MTRETPPSFSRSRKWSISFNVLISTVVVLGLVVMANYLAARHYWRLPLSFQARTELSEMTRRVLSGVTNEVKVIAYFDRQEPLFESVRSLLKEYKYACPKISLEEVDYISDPSAAQLAKVKYQLGSTADKNLIIFHVQGRPPRIVHEGELSELDIQPVVSGKSQEVRRTHFKGEMLFTSAILGVINPRPTKAYFLQGHGEHRPDSDSQQSGYSKFAGVLRENNVTVEMLTDLFGREEVPADCQLMIVAGPQNAFHASDLAKIDRYLKQGGRMLVLFNFTSVGKQLGLERLLANWGVNVGNNVVIDRQNGDRAGNMVITALASHAITKPLHQSSGLFMTLPRSIEQVTGPAASSDGLQVHPLIYTSKEGRVLTEIREGIPTQTPNDRTGDVSLIVAVEKGNLRGVSAERGVSRMVVTGDSLFLTNESIDALANRELATHAVNWLLARNELLAGLGPRPIKEYKLIVTQSQMRRLQWILLAGVPGGVLLLGGLVWVRRQKW